MRGKPKEISIIFAFMLFIALSGALARDFLTEQETKRLQNTQDIDKRTGIYMTAASLRLGAALDRFEGKESEPGDAMEFFSQEDMLDDYYKISEHVMLIVDDAFESQRRRENINIKKALNTLQSESRDNLKKLTALRKLSEEKRREELWDRIDRAIDITVGLMDGAKEGLSIIAERERKEAERR